MVRAVDMDVQTAGTVHFRSGAAHRADAFLKFGQFRIRQFRRDHFHAVTRVVNGLIAGIRPLFRVNAGVAHQFPRLALRVFHGPRVIASAYMSRLGSEISPQRPRGFLAGYAGHLHFHAVTLVFDADLTHAYRAASPRFLRFTPDGFPLRHARLPSRFSRRSSRVVLYSSPFSPSRTSHVRNVNASFSLSSFSASRFSARPPARTSQDIN